VKLSDFRGGKKKKKKEEGPFGLKGVGGMEQWREVELKVALWKI